MRAEGPGVHPVKGNALVIYARFSAPRRQKNRWPEFLFIQDPAR
jgi:hypothetical protein